MQADPCSSNYPFLSTLGTMPSIGVLFNPLLIMQGNILIFLLLKLSLVVSSTVI